MAMPFYLVDAFTDRPFAGNPAVVCPLPSWREEQWLQDVAAEMNQSETAFVVKAMFDRSGEQGPIRCQKGTPLGTIAIH